MGESVPLSEMLRARAERFARFAAWEAKHPSALSPADAVAAVGALYRLLPPESRHRPVDTTGVARMQAALRHLSR